MARWIAGMDGCRGAWATAFLDLDDPARHRLALLPDAGAVLDAPEAPSHVGIDIPIGLPERVGRGGRAADAAARAFLGPSRASVFPVPGRAAVFAPDYVGAKALSRATSDPPFAPSIQAWNIFPSIRAVDAVMRERAEARARVFEVHPEIAFFRLNGDRPLSAGKKGPARATGLALRRGLLEAAGLPPALVYAVPPRGVAPDDHLDALAALVVARAICEGSAVTLPEVVGRDAHGLPVAIWMPGPSGGIPGPSGEVQ